MEHVPKPTDSGIRNRQVRRRFGCAEFLRSPDRIRGPKKNQDYLGMLPEPEGEELVHRGCVFFDFEAARNRMTRSERFRRGVPCPQARPLIHPSSALEPPTGRSSVLAFRYSTA